MVKSSSVRQSWEATLRLSEARQVIQPKRPEPDRTARRLAACVNVDDVRQLAKRRLPRAVFDFVDGGADDEVTERENTAAFQSWRFSPRVLQDVGGADITTELFGRRYGAPLGLCPTGCPSMIHPLGEVAVARASAARELPYCISTAASTSIEALAATRHEDLWFQLYVLRDRGLTRSLVERAALSGYRLLEVTVDTAVSGKRERDARNGLTIPPSLSARTIADIAVHVGYWTEMLRGPRYGTPTSVNFPSAINALPPRPWPTSSTRLSRGTTLPRSGLGGKVPCFSRAPWRCRRQAGDFARDRWHPHLKPRRPPVGPEPPDR